MAKSDWADAPSQRGLSRIEREGLDWAVLLHSGQATSDDLAKFKAWQGADAQHAAAFASAAQLRRLAKTQRFQGSEQFPPGLFERLATRRAMLGGAVAMGAMYSAVVPPLGLWPSLAELTSDYRTGTGQRQRIALAEGVSLELNTRTSVSVKKIPGSAGVQLLSGEIAADIALPQDGQFTAFVGDDRVVARKASFDLRRFDSNACVTCTSGSVVVLNNGASAAVREGQQLIFTPGGAMGAVAAVNADTTVGWRNGQLEYRDASLANIVADINRYRTGKIVILNSALANRRYTAAFSVSDIEGVVDDLQRLTHASTRSLGSLVFMS